MRSASTWTFALLALALGRGCEEAHERDRSEHPAPAGSAAHVQPELAPPQPSDEPRGARCVRYRRQQSHEVEPGARVPNGSQTLLSDANDAPQLSHGPLLGAVASDGVKVWVRSDRAATWSVRVWPSGDEELGLSSIETLGPPLTAAGDFSASLRVSGLAPRSSYEYAVSLRTGGESDARARVVAHGEFHTLAPEGEPTRTRLVVGADITGSGSQPIFHQIGEVDPDFVLLIGDQVYADEAEPTRDGYAAFYRRNWNIKHLRPMLQHVPAFMIWDDHEIQDNYWLGKSDRYAPAREAYELYVHAHNPAAYRSDALYYAFRSGDVAFFVLDVRSYRSPNRAEDDEHKSMLGAQQKQDFLDWLTCEPATLKVVVSPVIWSDWATTHSDAWAAYITEREELLHSIAESSSRVLFVSGDQHWSAVFRFRREDYTFYEFLPTPLSKTRATAPRGESEEILARDDDYFVFGVVDIDTTLEPATIALTLCAEDKPCSPGEEPEPGTGLDLEAEEENVPFTVRLTADDFIRPKRELSTP